MASLPRFKLTSADRLQWSNLISNDLLLRFRLTSANRLLWPTLVSNDLLRQACSLWDPLT